MNAIIPTHDRKTRFWVNQKNTFGLLPGPTGSCPGATTGKNGCWEKLAGHKTATCYVSSILARFPNVRRVLQHNTELLQHSTLKQMTALICQEFDRFQTEEEKHGTVKNQRYYRLHWSGDFFNKTYARATRQAIQQFPRLHFWCYTRSFFSVPLLVDLPNLTLYLSLDPVNVNKGLNVFDRYNTDDNNLAVAYMSHNNQFPEQLTSRVSRLISCPVDLRKLSLENACSLCKNCIKPKPRNVWFNLK